jgi:uncharacterized protein (TIGR03437 family)
MKRPLIALVIFAVRLAAERHVERHLEQQEITPSPAGPFHISGNRIADSRGHAFLMRGTQLTEFHLQTVARDNRAGETYGPHSATSLSAIRLRFNMNTVRLPLDAREAGAPKYFSELAKVVERANDIDLLVVLAAHDAGSEFWRECAAVFKDYPNVMFDVSSEEAAVSAIRKAGAAQPIIVKGSSDDANIISEEMVAHWDLPLDDAEACAALPADPSRVSAMLEAKLDYFDAHQISWTVSTFEPGKLIKDLSFHDATTLENGWTCGPQTSAGLGRIVEAHLRASHERGLFVVSGSGGPDVARGALSLAYGPVMATRDAKRSGAQAPSKLGGISVQVTDSAGVTRPAGMLWASAGWGQTNFVIPQDSAVGPAVMTVVREDGSRSSSNITIGNTAPGFMTGESCRGPAIGVATEIYRDGRKASAPISSCEGTKCKTLAISMSPGAVTRVRLVASGFRYAQSASEIVVTIGGVRVPVIGYGPDTDPGMDFLTIEIPEELRGMGETDLMSHVGGRPSNAVRIYLAGQAGDLSY